MQLPQNGAPDWATVRSARQLGDRIASGRHSHDLTQSDLAAWLGVDRTTILRMEAGRVSQIDRLFEVLGVLGLDLVVVPRTARVIVEPADGDSAP